MITPKDASDYMRAKSGWVKAGEICCDLDITNRRLLRADGDMPGLLTLSAISGDDGFKHIANATTEEWSAYYQHERRRFVTGLVWLRKKRRLREAMLRTIPPPPQMQIAERDTNQLLLKEVIPA